MTLQQHIQQCQQFIQQEVVRLSHLSFENDVEKQKTIENGRRFLTSLNMHVELLSSNEAQLEGASEVAPDYAQSISFLYTVGSEIPQIESLIGYFRTKFKAFVPAALEEAEQELLEDYLKSGQLREQRGQSQMLIQRRSGISRAIQFSQLPLTYLHDLLRTSVHFVRSRIQPRFAAREFERLLVNGQIPLSAPLTAYPKYIYLGQVFKPKYGYYVDCVEKSNYLEVVTKEAENQKMSDIFVVLGRLFVESSRELDQKLNDGLKSARIAAAVNANGEISISVLVTRGEMQAVLSALFELIKKTASTLKNENRALLPDEIRSCEDIFKTIQLFPELQKNDKVLELLDEAESKLRDHYEQLLRYRTSREFLHQQTRGENATVQGIVIASVDPRRQEIDHERSACREVAENYAWLTTICKFIEFSEAAAVSNDETDWAEQGARFMEDQRRLTVKTQEELLTDVELPLEFSVRNVEQNLGGRSRSLEAFIKILSNGKPIAETAVPFTKTVDIDVTPELSRLGSDLSAADKPIFAEVEHKIGQKLPKLSVLVEIGSISGEVSLPLKEGEDRNAVDFVSQDLSYCVGYYMRTGVLMHEQPKSLDFVSMHYDPNLVIPIIENEPAAVEQQDDVEQKTIMSLDAYKRALRKHYELDHTKPENLLDPLNYVNLVEKATGDVLDSIEVDARAKRRHGALEDKQNKIGYSCKQMYKGILGETLFLYQYISNLKTFYDILLDDKQHQEKLTVAFPNFTNIKNPLIIEPFRRMYRPLYPVRVQERERTRILYEKYENKQEEASPAMMRSVTEEDSTKLLVNINYLLLKTAPPSLDTQYYIFARVTGNAEEDVQIGPCQLVKQLVQVNEQIEFAVPLPRVFREGQESPIGFDNSDETFAQLPFSLKLVVFENDTKYAAWTSIGQVILPLRTVFLKSRIEGELYFQAFDMSIIVSFKPPRMLLKTPELEFCQIDASGYSGSLPDDFSARYQQILALNTRLGELSAAVQEQERALLVTFSSQKRMNYFKKYATKLSYSERGITLFAKTLDGEDMFLSQFVPTAIECDNLAEEMNVRNELDCVNFAAAIPFVPDCFVRSYTTEKIGEFLPETRMRTDEVFALCGGDYFEHACFLCGLLNSRSINAYAARICTETLYNEYFVLVVRETAEASYFIDPVHAVRYPFSSPSITRLIEIFNAEGVYVNGGIDMRPSSVSIADYIAFKTPEQTTSVLLSDFLPRKEAGQEEALENALVETIRSDFCHRREPQNTMFDEAVSAELTQDNLECLENFNYQLVAIKCAYEDAAILLEKINQTQIYNTEQKVQFAISVVVRGYGNRFAVLDVKLARLAHKDGGVQQRIISLEGGKFGTEM